MNEPVLGDMYTDEHGVDWIYAGKAGWRRVVEADTKYSDIISDGGLDPRDRVIYQRQWIDLTDDEIWTIADNLNRHLPDFHNKLAHAVIAAFKEKNK